MLMLIDRVAQFVGVFTLVFCTVIGLGLAFCWSIGLFDWEN